MANVTTAIHTVEYLAHNLTAIKPDYIDYLLVVYCSGGICGLTASLTIIVAYFRTRQIHSSSCHYAICILAIADAIFSLGITCGSLLRLAARLGHVITQ